MESSIDFKKLAAQSAPAILQCSVCGFEINFNSDIDSDTKFFWSGQAKNGLSKESLTSSLFKCVSDTEQVTVQNCHAEDLNFCVTCKSYLAEWREMKDQISVLIEKTSRIKWTMIAKLLTQYSNKRQRNSVGEATSGFPRMISDLVSRFVKQWLPSVAMERTEFVLAGNSQMEQQIEFDNNNDDDWANLHDAEGGSDDVTNDIAPAKPRKYKKRSARPSSKPTAKRKRQYLKPDSLQSVEGAPNSYVYRGYSVTWNDKRGKYQCSLCQCLAKGIPQIVHHLNRKHIWNMSKRSVPSLTTQVGPNEFLYQEKYKIRYDPGEQVYSCDLCGKKFEKMNSVFPHIRNYHYTDEDKIQFSAVQISDTEYLYGGKYPIHYRDGRYHCGLCRHSKQEIGYLYSHIRVCHNGDEKNGASQPSAPTCDADEAGESQIEPEPSAATTLTAPQSYKYNEISYSFDTILKKYTCSICSESMNYRSSMITHIQRRHVEKPDEVCDRCGRTFKSKLLLARHEERHGEPKHKCEYCGKLFRGVKNFKLHVALHKEGEAAKKFVCEYCGKGFTFKGYLVKHVRIHTGEKPYPCSLCDEMFADFGKKSYHMKTVHGHVPRVNVLD